MIIENQQSSNQPMPQPLHISHPMGSWENQKKRMDGNDWYHSSHIILQKTINIIETD